MDESATPLLSQALDDLELEPEQDRKNIIQSDKQKHLSWLIPFCVNIFLACVSFSIVQPSLAAYLNQIGAPISYLPWVVSSYSIGEMLGSVAIGSFYEYAVRTFKVLGRGPRYSIFMCLMFGIVGSVLYACAGWIQDTNVAKYCIVIGRVLQGISTGGRQAVEPGEKPYLTMSIYRPFLETKCSFVLYSISIGSCSTIRQSGIHVNTDHLCSFRICNGTHHWRLIL